MTDIQKDHLKLKWLPPKHDGGKPVRAYKLEIKEVGDKEWRPLTHTKDIKETVHGLQEAHAYRFRVQAVNEEGGGPWLESDKAVSFNRPPKLPSIPEGPIRFHPLDLHSVELAWQMPLDDGGVPLKGFVIQMTSKQRPWETVGEVDAFQLRHKITGLEPNVNYYFRVAAKNSVGTGEPLHSDAYVTKEKLKPPGQPDGPLTGINTKLGAIRLDWSAPKQGGKPDYYIIESFDFDRNTWSRAGRAPGDEETLTLDRLKPGQKHLFRITAVNDAGSSEPLDMDRVIVCTSPFSVPDAPEPPIVFSEVTETSAVLSWSPPLDDGGAKVREYKVEMSYAHSPVWHRVGRVPGEQPWIKATGLLRGKEYTFRVAAINEHGTGPFLQAQPLKTADPPCKCSSNILRFLYFAFTPPLGVHIFTTCYLNLSGLPHPPAWIKVVARGADNVSLEWSVPH